MEITEEKIAEIAATAAAKRVEELKQPVRKYLPGDEKPPEGDAPKFKTFGEYLRAVADHFGQRMEPGDWRKKALSEGTDSAGGFTVPEQFAAGIEVYSLESEIVRPLARKQPMTSDTFNYPIVKDTTHACSVYGGVIAYWTEEAGTKTVAQPTFGRVKLIAKKLTGFTYASDELLEDSAIGLEALLMKLFGDAIGWYEEEAFWQGNGVGQPLGIMNSGALIQVPRAAVTAVSLADLGGIMARFLGNFYAPSVAWVANKAVLPQLINLGNAVITWATISGQRVPGSILGIPLYFTEHQATLGSVGDIGLYDFDQYLIGDRKGLKVDRSIEYRFSTDETTWRFVKRVDGQPLVDSTFTPARGTTKSPFVCLASTTT
jgi:HK97 family phage major capsid protein